MQLHRCSAHPSRHYLYRIPLRKSLFTKNHYKMLLPKKMRLLQVSTTKNDTFIFYTPSISSLLPKIALFNKDQGSTLKSDYFTMVDELKACLLWFLSARICGKEQRILNHKNISPYKMIWFQQQCCYLNFEVQWQFNMNKKKNKIELKEWYMHLRESTQLSSTLMLTILYQALTFLSPCWHTNGSNSSKVTWNSITFLESHSITH